MKCIDLKGQIFGKWKVLERKENSASGRARWLCERTCEKHIQKIIDSDSLRRGKTYSCGCERKPLPNGEKRIGNMPPNVIDLTNKQFGFLKVLKITNKRDNGGHILWKCQCNHGQEKCNNPIICYVPTHRLNNGNTLSCGCLKSKGEMIISNLLQEAQIDFETQKSFKDCIFPNSNRYAYFDFYLPKFNILIEYDGIQHFEYKNCSTFWNNKEEFLNLKKRDEFKNQWAQKNKIILIRIPYYDKDKINKDYLLNLINNCRYCVR